MGEITALYERLAGSRRFGGGASHWLLPLHSTVSPAEQRQVCTALRSAVLRCAVLCLDMLGVCRKGMAGLLPQR